ncbi:hypothetical protein SLA2020_378120 [Shorea laevis]
MAEEVVLFGSWGIPFSRRVEMALKLKGVEYKYIEEDITNKSPSLLKYNPVHKKIPVLERAVARFWAKFIDDKCLPVVFKAFWGEEKEREKAAEEASELLNFVENEINEKRFFGGESIGMVDVVANIIAFWLGVFEEATGVELLTREKFPKLSNWSDEFVSNSVIKESLPPRDKLIAYFRHRFGGVNASK